MALSELFLPEFDAEMAATRRMLERVPDGKNAWQPHPRSMTLVRLATHIAEIPGWSVRALSADGFDVAPPGAPPYQPRTIETTAERLALFDQNVAEARRAIAAASDADFAAPWTFKRGGQTVWTKPKHEVYRSMAMSHSVHHRAQLGVFLRLQDVPIPGVYGPSADDRRA